MRDESGFTLIELMAVIVLMAILMTLGVGALRRFWFVQGLSGAQNEVVSQLRTQQELSRTTAPKVFGARFTVGSSSWDLIRYDPEATPPCGPPLETRTFDAGVVVQSVDFDPALPAADLIECLDGSTDLVLFYARGSATPGGLTVAHETIDKELDVCVTGLTGRVEAC